MAWVVFSEIAGGNANNRFPVIIQAYASGDIGILLLNGFAYTSTTLIGTLYFPTA